jgi:hypothetical protein
MARPHVTHYLIGWTLCAMPSDWLESVLVPDPALTAPVKAVSQPLLLQQTISLFAQVQGLPSPANFQTNYNLVDNQKIIKEFSSTTH